MCEALESSYGPARERRCGTSKRVRIAGAAALLSACGAALAQDEVPEQHQADDVIIVEGEGSPNRAMNAFNAGDYATAEIEFEKNMRCALRRERNREAGLDQLQSGAIDRTVRSGGASNGGGQAAAAVGPASASDASFRGVASSVGEAEEAFRVATCADRGFQIYMMAMSQLQLGKADEARRRFEQAVEVNEALYDAHYRLGLMKVLDDDPKGAAKHVKAIRRLSKQCRGCGEQGEIDARVAQLDRAVEGGRPR